MSGLRFARHMNKAGKAGDHQPWRRTRADEFATVRLDEDTTRVPELVGFGGTDRRWADAGPGSVGEGRHVELPVHITGHVHP